ncbi:MAG: LysR family transcriptional regulator, partial [Pseudomonadota bacterium]
MDHSTLRLFLEVARRLSFAEVAAQRGLNPSSVSRSIAGLEDGLGVRLFQRTTRRMTLTESGAIFYRRVGELLDEFDQACEEARALSASPAGTLRMTASVAFGERMIVPLLPRFRALYPDVRLDLKFTDANVDLIAEGIDLAVRLGSRMVTDAIVTRLISTRYRICASPAYLQQADPIAAPADL